MVIGDGVKYRGNEDHTTHASAMFYMTKIKYWIDELDCLVGFALARVPKGEVESARRHS